MLKTASDILYNILLALWTGGMFLYTFLVTPVIFRSYNRDMAGEIVGKLFPAYFSFNLGLSVLTLLVALLAAREWKGYKISLVLISAAIVINIFVTFRIYPEVLKVKQQIVSFETASPESELRKKFRTLHGVSMALNLLLLSDGTALLCIYSLGKNKIRQ